MPYPWPERIAYYAGDIDIGLNALEVTDPPVRNDNISFDRTEFGYNISFGVGCPTAGNTSLPAPGFPNYVEVGGIETTPGMSPSPASKGMKQYGAYTADSLGSFTSSLVIDSKIVHSFGGRAWDISASAVNFGVESYWYWIDDWAGFTGGTVTEAMPSYRHILVDWGNDSMDRETTIYHNALPCPPDILSPGSDVPYAINIEQHISTNDPNGFNDRLIGWIVGPDYAEDELLQSGLTTVNVCQSDDPVYRRWGTILLVDESTTRSDISNFDCWSHFTLTALDGTGPDVPVLVRWQPTPLYTSVGVVGAPDCDLYTAKWEGVPSVSELVTDPLLMRATNEGWVGAYFYDPTPENWSTRYALMLTNASHSSWQRMVLRANDDSACDYLASGVCPSVYLDRHGRWIFHWGAGAYSSSYENAENDITDLILEEAWFYAEVSDPEWNGFVCPAYEPEPEPLPGDGVVIDDEGLEGTGSLNVNAWGFSLDGHDFYVIKLGTSGTIVYDLATGQWCEWASPGASNLRLESGMNWLGMGATSLGAGDARTKIVAGDDTLGVLWTLDPDIGYDEHPTTLTPTAFQRVAVGGIPMRLRETTKVGGAYLTCCVGDPQLSGAEISLETSDDYGQTFQAHGTITTTVDDFTQEIAWRSIGLIKAPGRIFRIIDNGASVRLDSLDLK